MFPIKWRPGSLGFLYSTTMVGLSLLVGLSITESPALSKEKKGKQAPAAKPSPEFAEVQKHYKEGRYKDALDKLATLQPSELTHYYAGLCYQGQNQLQLASSEFQWVAYYSKNPKLKYNAQSALNTLNAYSQNRTYKGQGNNFARVARGGGGGGGGSTTVVRRS